MLSKEAGVQTASPAQQFHTDHIPELSKDDRRAERGGQGAIAGKAEFQILEDAKGSGVDGGCSTT